MLEETALANEPHYVHFDADDQLSPEFLSLNPITRYRHTRSQWPGRQAFALFESGAILIYLADKAGKFLRAMRPAAIEVCNG